MTKKHCLLKTYMVRWHGEMKGSSTGLRGWSVCGVGRDCFGTADSWVTWEAIVSMLISVVGMEPVLS